MLCRMLQAALRSQDVGEAVAAEHVIRAFCHGNPEGQSSLGATLLQVDDPGMAQNEVNL